MTTEQIRRQISLFIDDELSAEECEFFVRRLQRDPESRNLYMRYQIIGAAIRGEHVNPGHAVLRHRLRDALSETTEKRSRVPSVRRFGGIVKAAAGAGIAAGVAAVALVVLRADFGAAGIDQPGTLVAAEQRLEPVEPPSYVVPLRVPDRPVVAPEVRLIGLQYLMHHSAHASGLSRTVVHSNVLAADRPDVIAAIEAETR